MSKFIYLIIFSAFLLGNTVHTMERSTTPPRYVATNLDKQLIKKIYAYDILAAIECYRLGANENVVVNGESAARLATRLARTHSAFLTLVKLFTKSWFKVADAAKEAANYKTR